MRLFRLLTLVVVVAGLAGCDDDSPFAPDRLPRDAVAGIYSMTRLTFDPDGDAFEEVDVLTIFPAEARPELDLLRTTDVFQLFFRDPDSQRRELLEGDYSRMAGGIRLVLPADPAAETILFPGEIELEFDSTAHTLAFEGAVDVPLGRLRTLVPELGDEPLADPVPGVLSVTFVLEGS